LSWVDYLIIGVISVSALISLTRGFIRECLSLAAWVLALWVALSFSPRVVELLLNKVAMPPSLQRVIAFFILMLGTLLAAAIMNSLLLQLVQKTGLTGMDRMLGMVFGIGRGIAIVTGLVLLAGMTPMPQDAWWQDSQLLYYFQGLALRVQSLIPPDIANYIRF
jgi:membrane protein required for colicin V production